MRNSKLPGKLVVALGILVLLIGGAVAVAATMGNDFLCSTAEQRAMSGFPHYGSAHADWESNAKVTGGCTTSFTVEADPNDVLAYYQERLSQQGWTVQPPPASTFPIYLEAERDGLQYFLMFEGADPFAPPPGEGDEAVLKAGTPLVTQFDGFSLSPGQTRVSIMGGRQR